MSWHDRLAYDSVIPIQFGIVALLDEKELVEMVWVWPFFWILEVAQFGCSRVKPY